MFTLASYVSGCAAGLPCIRDLTALGCCDHRAHTKLWLVAIVSVPMNLWPFWDEVKIDAVIAVGFQNLNNSILSIKMYKIFVPFPKFPCAVLNSR